MKSIAELRTICQKPKIDDREKVGITYKDWKTRVDLYISIYFTRVFLAIGLSANIVTILSGLCAVIGGILLASSTEYIIIIGLVFFYLYTILDFSDGEVARYNKQGGLNGWFLDWYMHFIRDASLFIGLAIGAYNIEKSNIVLICGFITVLIPAFDKSIVGCGWTVISWTQLGILSKGVNLKNITNEPLINMENIPVKKKYINIPFIIFQHHWSLIILIGLIVMQVIMDKFFSIRYDFRSYLIIYTGIMGPAYIFMKLYIIIKQNILQQKYNILFKNLRKPNAKDYF